MALCGLLCRKFLFIIYKIITVLKMTCGQENHFFLFWRPSWMPSLFHTDIYKTNGSANLSQYDTFIMILDYFCSQNTRQSALL